MTLQSEAGQIIVNQSRGLDQGAEQIALRGAYGWDGTADAALKDAKDRQHAVIVPLRTAASQHSTLQTQLGAARTTAVAIRDVLTAVKSAASTDLDNPEAGDT